MTAVVLMYHRVASVDRDAYGLAVHPERFQAHVEALAKTGAVVPLQDVLAPGQAPSVAITFDDGYADNATVAAPLLEAAGLPATYFITTGRLGTPGFWWDRLADALLGDYALPEGVDVVVDRRPLWLSLTDRSARDTALRFLHRRLRPLPPDELAVAVDAVIARLGSPDRPAPALAMTVDQLRALAESSHAQIGGHTRTHLQLAGQSSELQREEVVGSVEDLRALLGRPVTTFAYPFGTAGAVGDLAPRLVADAGCVLACSTDRAAVTRRSDRLWLPRLNVRDWTADELQDRIRGLAAHG